MKKNLSKPSVSYMVDGINFNARHYSEIENQAEALAAFKKDHEANDHFDDDKAEEYFKKMIEHVANVDSEALLKSGQGTEVKVAASAQTKAVAEGTTLVRK